MIQGRVVPVGILINISLPIVRQFQRFCRDDSAPVVDHHKGRDLTRNAPALVIMPDIVGIQAIRDSIPLDADAGEQCRLSSNRDLFVGFGHCMKGHNLSSPYIKKQDNPHGLPCKSKGRASEDTPPVDNYFFLIMQRFLKNAMP